MGSQCSWLIWIVAGLLIMVVGSSLLIWGCLMVAKRADEQADRILKVECEKTREN